MDKTALRRALLVVLILSHKAQLSEAAMLLLVLQYIWVANSDICGPLLKSICPAVKQVMEDSTHLMRCYMKH